MKRVLIIDDDETILNNLEVSFTTNNIEVVKCSNRDEALAAINDSISFDAVILDWYFVLDNDSGICKQLLRELKNKHFKPVFIYTGNIEDFRNTDKSELEFPSNLLIEYFKTETDINALREHVQNLLNTNISLQIASLYRKRISVNFERVLFELNELPNVDLAKVLSKIYGDGSNVDWSNDMVLNLLHRSLISDSAFINGITVILQAASNINKVTSPEIRRRITNKILYFHSKSDFIRNGDIVCLKKTDNSLISYGIVVTPDCDLEQKKTRIIEIVELSKIDDEKLALKQGQKDNIKQYNHDSFFLFPSINIGGRMSDFVAILKSKFILLENSVAKGTKYPLASKRLLYSQTFAYNGQEMRLELICTKVNPYKAEFLQKLHSNNSRVGIPDIKDLL